MDRLKKYNEFASNDMKYTENILYLIKVLHKYVDKLKNRLTDKFGIIKIDFEILNNDETEYIYSTTLTNYGYGQIDLLDTKTFIFINITEIYSQNVIDYLKSEKYLQLSYYDTELEELISKFNIKLFIDDIGNSFKKINENTSDLDEKIKERYGLFRKLIKLNNKKIKNLLFEYNDHFEINYRVGYMLEDRTIEILNLTDKSSFINSDEWLYRKFKILIKDNHDNLNNYYLTFSIIFDDFINIDSIGIKEILLNQKVYSDFFLNTYNNSITFKFNLQEHLDKVYKVMKQIND